MIVEQVDSEQPSLHWKYIECNGKVAVDFGCGRWEHIEFRDPSWPTTPEYLAQLGASKVYAFDIDQNEINWYIENVTPTYPQITPICSDINSVDVVRGIYNQYKPDVIKCDIEHNERFILELSDEEFSIPSFYALETHTDNLYQAFFDRFNDLNYEVISTIDLVHAPPMKVIFAKKKN
jgi:hypothetical protein